MSDQRTALVTGASRGIGAAIAAKLAADGFFVVGTATSDAGAESVARRLGDQGTGLKLDISDADSVAEVISRVAEIASAPLVLVNNAGITRTIS